MSASVYLGEDAQEIVPSALALLAQAGLEPYADPRRVPLRVTGTRPPLDTCHKIVDAAAIALAAAALAVEALWRLGGGVPQELAIDLKQAAAAIYPARYQRQNGYPVPLLPGSELAQDFFETSDGRWFYPVASYPKLRNKALEILDCANTRPALARAIRRETADDLEALFARHKVPAAYVRTKEQWRRHPQGRVLSASPVIDIRRIGDAPPSPMAAGHRPLAGVRVLDVSHVIAGPVAARTLAEHGADTLRVSAPYQPDPLVQTMDTGIGKRSAFLDLQAEHDREALRSLCCTADVFVDSWRPGSMARLGFGPTDLATLHPGIVYVSVSTYGPNGPWADRGGFEQIGQLVSGICHDEGGGGRPRLVPTHFLNDYLTGYLAAAGAVAALYLQRIQGGSYHVNVSLARTSMWVQELGRQVKPSAPVDPFAIEPDLEARNSPYGRLEQLPPVVAFSHTPARWDLPPSPLGAHSAEWLSDEVAPVATTAKGGSPCT